MIPSIVKHLFSQVILFIAGGAVLFSIWEDWNFFDGAYYSFITLSTIGFGDIVPGQSLDEGSQEKLIVKTQNFRKSFDLKVCALYLLFGMALIAMCFKLMQDDVVQKARWLGQRIGIIGERVSHQKSNIIFTVREQSESDESEFDEEIVLGDEDDFGGIFQGEGDDLLLEDPEEDMLSVKTDQEKRTLSSSSSTGGNKALQEEMRAAAQHRRPPGGPARRGRRGPPNRRGKKNTNA